MAEKPNLAVLIAAHNAEKHLAETVASVFQENIPLHLFIVDDASEIPVTEIVPLHPQITVIRSEGNIGLASALNLGLREILTQDFEFIARLDADDLCVNNRWQQQLTYMRGHPEIDLVGSWLRFIDEDKGDVLRHYQPPETHEEIIKQLPFNSCVLHPSWFMRTTVMQKLYPYNTHYPAAEDYEFLLRAAQNFRLGNVPAYLVDARDTHGGISRRRRQQQLQDRLALQLRFFAADNWRCYLGVLKTSVLLCLPYEFIIRLKNFFHSRA